MSEKPVYPEGTEPIYETKDGEEELVGYRIKKGVLGITKDIEVIMGPEPNREATFQARRSMETWKGPVANTYDRYLKLMCDEVDLCRRATHVVREREQPWESTPQGRLKWMVHPLMESSTEHQHIYFQELPAASRSGKHCHVAEELILVLEGRGYDVHDGERWDWEQGELICIPTMTVHQHFNLGKGRALLLSTMANIYPAFGLGGIEQIENAPEYSAL